MKLYELSTEHCPELRKHPEFVNQRPHPVGIMGSGVYKFNGTNVYSWYVNKSAGFWTPYGEPVVLRPHEIRKFKKQQTTAAAQNNR